MIIVIGVVLALIIIIGLAVTIAIIWITYNETEARRQRETSKMNEILSSASSVKSIKTVDSITGKVVNQEQKFDNLTVNQ